MSRDKVYIVVGSPGTGRGLKAKALARALNLPVVLDPPPGATFHFPCVTFSTLMQDAPFERFKFVGIPVVELVKSEEMPMPEWPWENSKPADIEIQKLKAVLEEFDTFQTDATDEEMEIAGKAICHKVIAAARGLMTAQSGGKPCPQCGSGLYHPRGDALYCEDCGFPDENREWR